MVFIVLFFLILGVANHTQSNLLYIAFGLMVGALISSLALSWFMLRGLEVQRLLPLHGVASENSILRYRVVNHKSWMPVFGLVITENWGTGNNGYKKSGPVAEFPARLKGRPHGWILHIGPNQSVQCDAVCWPLMRGQLRFERIIVSTAFPFGIIHRVMEIEQPDQLLVYPRLYRVNRKILSEMTRTDAGGGRKHRDQPGGHEEFFGLREYRPGDSLKLVDWKRTACTGELVTKELNQASPPRVMIVLDLTDLPAPEELLLRKNSFELGKYVLSLLYLNQYEFNSQVIDNPILTEIESAISLTSSLICEAHTRGYQIGLAVMGLPGQPFPIYHSFPHRMKMLESLSMLDLMTRSKDRSALFAQPSVVVKLGEGMKLSRGTMTKATIVLGAAMLDEYIIQHEGETSELLHRRVSPSSRRELVLEGKA